MLIFSYFWLNIMVKLALTGLNVLSMINFCYFPKDFLGLSVLTSQKVEKMPKKNNKKKRHLKQQICLFLLIFRERLEI